MINWRQPVLYALYGFTGNSTLREFRNLLSIEKKSHDELKQLQEQSLSRLLLHAYRCVPYYHHILADAEVVVSNRVHLENFSRLPILTKDIIRQQGENLISHDYKNRHPFQNTSGGSTGEPVVLTQDRHYHRLGMANKMLCDAMLGKSIAGREIIFWGSDRDIITGTLSLRNRLINFLHNCKFFNAYQLDDQRLAQLVALNNSFRPQSYLCYMEAALELARYIAREKPYFHSPEILVSTIGPLTEQVRRQIESALDCKVYNHYGSREVGAIACQCPQQKRMHTLPWWNYLEILDENNQPAKQKPGNVIVTPLHNYSMPLIRYEIGDVATAGDCQCPCGRNTFTLDAVLGRTLGYFKKPDGSLAHSHFLVQALFFRKWIKRFQIIQTALDQIHIRIEKDGDSNPSAGELSEITEKTKLLMGPECKTEFDFVDRIEPSKSGKYIYTVCQVR